MTKYRLTKANVRLLIAGKHIVDGSGRKYFVPEGSLMKDLEYIDKNDLYGEYDIFLCDGSIDIVDKERERG